MFKTTKKDRWGERKTESISFDDYVKEYLALENMIKKPIDDMMKQVKRDVERRIKETFDSSARSMLAENVYSVLMASDSYRKIENGIKQISAE